MQNGAQDSMATHKVGTQSEFPAEIPSWLMSKYLNQVRFSQKLAFLMQTVFTLLDWQILMTRLLSSILPKMQECKMKIMPVHGFSAPTLDCCLAKLGRMCCISEKNSQNECIDAASAITLACYYIIAAQDLGTISIKGYVHGDVPIWLRLLKLWLPINHPDLPELLEIAFEVILPGHNKHKASHYSKIPH